MKKIIIRNKRQLDFFKLENELMYYRGSLLNGEIIKFHQNGRLSSKINYKDGKADGLFDTYHNDGKLNERKCYKNGERTDMSYCEK